MGSGLGPEASEHLGDRVLDERPAFIESIEPFILSLTDPDAATFYQFYSV